MSFKKTNGKPIRPYTDPREYHAHVALFEKDGPGHQKGDPIPHGHAAFIMSRSELANFGVCPRKWILAPKTEPTKAMQDGALLDTLLLSPKNFEATYVKAPLEYPRKPTPKDPATSKPWNYKATFCQEWRDEQHEAGKLVCTCEEVEQADLAIKRLFDDERIHTLFQNSSRQVMMEAQWHDEGTGLVIPFKCLIDILPHAAGPCGKMIADFKRTGDAEPDRWTRHSFDQELYYQAAVYLDIANACTGDSYTEFVNVISESVAPYEPARRRFTMEFIALGRARYQRDLAFYCHCLKNGKWPGYDDMNLNDPNCPVVDGWRSVDPQPWMVKKFA